MKGEIFSVRQVVRHWLLVPTFRRFESYTEKYGDKEYEAQGNCRGLLKMSEMKTRYKFTIF